MGSETVSTGLRVAVVGGGIGGLFTAIALRAAGLQASMYEQAPELGEVGAGVFLTPNSVRQLERVGLGPQVECWGARVGFESRYFRADGTPIAPGAGDRFRRLERDLWHAPRRFGGMLAARLPAEVVHTGHRCVDFSQTGDAARLDLRQWRTVEADLVVAADGIHSSCDSMSRTVATASSPARWPIVAWSRMSASPTGRRTLADVARQSQALPGLPRARRARLSTTSASCRPTRRCRNRGRRRAIPTRSAPSSPAGTRESAAAVAKSTYFRWALYDREPLPAGPRGRLTLLGDAAHPMLPHLGQGANQSIEDGMALATLLARPDAKRPCRADRYESLRRERVAEVQRGARQNGLRYDPSSMPILPSRDAEIAAHAAFAELLYDYDVLPTKRRRLQRSF